MADSVKEASKNKIRRRKVAAVIFTVIILCSGITFSNKSRNNFGQVMGIFGIYMIVRNSALGGGLSLLFLFPFFKHKLSSTCIYLFFISMNIAVGLLGIVDYFNDEANRWWLHESLLNGFVGITMVATILLSGKNKIG